MLFDHFWGAQVSRTFNRWFHTEPIWILIKFLIMKNSKQAQSAYCSFLGWKIEFFATTFLPCTSLLSYNFIESIIPLLCLLVALSVTFCPATNLIRWCKYTWLDSKLFQHYPLEDFSSNPWPQDNWVSISFSLGWLLEVWLVFVSKSQSHTSSLCWVMHSSLPLTMFWTFVNCDLLVRMLCISEQYAIQLFGFPISQQISLLVSYLTHSSQI
jgi:hypothetical protein